MKKILSLICILVIIISGYVVVASKINNFGDDLDPLVDISLTVDVLAIRALDKIERRSDPDFFVNVIINDEEFTSPTWNDQN